MSDPQLQPLEASVKVSPVISARELLDELGHSQSIVNGKPARDGKSIPGGHSRANTTPSNNVALCVDLRVASIKYD